MTAVRVFLCLKTKPSNHGIVGHKKHKNYFGSVDISIAPIGAQPRDVAVSGQFCAFLWPIL